MAKGKKPISVVDRRLTSGSVFASGTQPIPLTEPNRWTARVVNSQISDARMWEMQASKGWVYAERADLAVDPLEIGFREQDGRIVRGTQGHEVLMKMERADYKKIVAHKDAENRARVFRKDSIKQQIVAGASATLGDQAATFLNQQDVSITDHREAVPLED